MTQLALKWVFVLDGDYAWPSGRSFAEDCAFEDSSGKRRLEIRKNGEIKVLAGYAWDGCTPKFSLWDICVGTPDGVPNANTKKPKAYYASLLHDALYQFSMQGLPAPSIGARRSTGSSLSCSRVTRSPREWSTTGWSGSSGGSSSTSTRATSAATKGARSGSSRATRGSLFPRPYDRHHRNHRPACNDLPPASNAVFGPDDTSKVAPGTRLASADQRLRATTA